MLQTKLCEGKPCSDLKLCAFQWGSKAVTELIGKPLSITGYRSMNSSIPLDYEFCGDDLEARLTNEEALRLLDKTADGKMTNNAYSLLNFTNGQFLIDNLDKVDKVMAKFYLSKQKAESLIKYYNSTLNSLKLASNSPELSYFRARFSRDGLLDALNLLRHYTFNNITMQGFSQLYNDRKGNATCKAYFLDTQGRNLPTKICTDPLITLDTYQGIIMWTIAKYKNFQNDSIVDFDAYNFIKKRLGLVNDEDLDFLLSSSLFNSTMWEVQNDFLSYFGCFDAPCDRRFLAERQFYQSSITNLGNKLKYPTLKVKSIADFEVNHPLLGNKIPEIYGFYERHFKYNGKIFGGEQDKVFSNNVGRIQLTQAL